MAKLEEYSPAQQPDSSSNNQSKERDTPPCQNQMADIVARHLKDKLVFDAVVKEWYEKSGHIWKACTDIYAEGIIEKAIQREREGFAYTYLSGVSKFLRIRLLLSQWAEDNYYLPMADGVLNLTTNELEPVGDRLFNWQLPHKYTDKTECPVITGWLEQVTQGNQDLINLLRAWMYAVLTGRADLQKYIEIIGHGGTGKSTFIRLCTQLVGDDNSATTDLKSLEQSRFESAALYGKRLALITDSSAYGGNVDILKAITGQDTIRRERKNKDPSSFVYGGMVMIAANESIQSKDYTSGLSRRRIPIRFDYRVTEGDKRKYPNGIENEMQKEIPALIASLLSQGSAILDYIRNPVDSIQQSKLDMELDTNPLLSWMNQRLVVTSSGDEPTRAQLHNDYKEYCIKNGHNSLAITRFNGLVVDNAITRGIQTATKDTASKRIFAGLRLRRQIDRALPLFSKPMTPNDTYDSEQESPKRRYSGANDTYDTYDGFKNSENFKEVVSL